MTQHNTIMKLASFYAYCQAWCVAENSPPVGDARVGSMLADDAVRAGIVFG